MKFSIGIPAYKVLFLKECVESILNQTYTDFELIIVNDASPQDIEGIIMTYNDQRIRYFKNERNFGAEHVVDNWNKCLSFAKGEYFILMGDDDRLDKDYLNEFLKIISKYEEFKVFHCKSILINEKSEIIGETISWPEIESVYANIWYRMIAKRQHFISDFVFKTDELLKIGGFYFLPMAWGSDDITSYIIGQDKGIVSINLPLLNYRISTLTLSNSNYVELKLNSIQLEIDWIKNFLINFKPILGSDIIYYKKISNYIKKYRRKKRIGMVLNFYKSYNMFYFIKILNSYKLNNIEKINLLFSYLKFHII